MTEQTTTEAIASYVIPEAALAVLGHNSGLAYYADVGKLESRLALIGEVLTTSTAPLMRDVMKDAHTKAGVLEDDRMAAQKPHQETIENIRAAYRPLHERALAVKETARLRLDKFLAAEELRIQQEARDAQTRLDEQREAADAARREAEGSPFAQGAADDADQVVAELEVDAQHAAKRVEAGPTVSSASGLARAAGYRYSYAVEVEDAAKLVHHFRKHPDLIAAATKLANASARASKGATPIPGCKMVETRKAV